MIVAKSFLRGLMIGSLQVSLFIYSLVFGLFGLDCFLHSKGIDLPDPENIPGIIPGSERTRLSLFSVFNYISLVFYFSYLVSICFNFQRFLRNWGNGNVERFGRKFYYMFSMFPVHLLIRIVYEMQINCGCEDNALTPYLKVISGFIPIIFNVILMTSYGLICLCFSCKIDESTQMIA